MSKRTLFKAASVAAVAALLASACASDGDDGDEGGDPAAGGVITIAIAEPRFLLPSNTTETGGGQVLNALFTPLVVFDADLNVVMAAAESITSEDNITWTIKLKEGYTFHNGEDVTADNYINAWNHGALQTNGMQANYFFGLLGIEGYDELNPGEGEEPTATEMSGLTAIDDLTFEVTLTDQFADFPKVVNYIAFDPLPDAAFIEPGVIDPEFQEAPIGNGPFQMVGTWQHDQQIEVEAYPDHPEAEPNIGGVVFKIYQDQTAAYQDLLSDNVDVITVPTESLGVAESDLGERYVQKPNSSFQFLAFPAWDERFEDPAVRIAISKAIDRQAQIDAIFQGSQSVADGFVSPVVAGYRPGACGVNCEFDPAAAKAEYDAAGGPAELNISYNADGGHQEWVDATCNQLATNLEIECAGTPEPSFPDLLNKADAEEPIGAFRLGWIMDYPSMGNYLGPLYSTPGSSNYYGYSNEEFDQLVRDGDTAATPEDAIAAYQAAEDILVEEMPVLPMRFGQDNMGISTRVQNFDLDPFGWTLLLQVEVTE
jgi:peptide/nickel transport system substrate-binding protein/oligopeptide transport system substrate-binding protein